MQVSRPGSAHILDAQQDKGTPIFSRLRLESMAILLILVGVAWLLMDRLPDVDEILKGGHFILVFAALLPTMTLVRATAGKMVQVQESQKRLASLPTHSSTAGFQLAVHFFGSIINFTSIKINNFFFNFFLNCIFFKRIARKLSLGSISSTKNPSQS